MLSHNAAKNKTIVSKPKYRKTIILTVIILLIPVILSVSLIMKKEKSNNIFLEKNGDFYIYGLTLGDSYKDVQKLHGPPISEKIEDQNIVLEYENFNITIFNETVRQIYLPIYNDSMEVEFFRRYDGDMYISEDYTYYFYEQGSEQLLFFKTQEDITMGFNGYLTYVDDNFKYYLESGYIQPFEEGIQETTSDIVEDYEYINAFSTFHFSHKEVVEEATQATVNYINTNNGKEKYTRALKDLLESTKHIENLPFPANNSELKTFDDVYRIAINQLPESLESIVFYAENGDQSSLDATIKAQTQLGAEIDFAAQQILARKQ